MTDCLLIDGRLVTGAGELDVRNPATGETIATVARASADQALDAIQAAKRAFPGWSSLTTSDRHKAIGVVEQRLRARRDELARALVSEQGKPLSEALIEIDFAIAFAKFFATADVPPEIVQDDSAYRIELHHRPLGVVVGITPWNFPLLIAVYKMLPALLMGNTFVLKPAPTTPITSLMLAQLVADVFPAGVVNVVVDANDLGALLTSHPDVAKISFTGSTATGRKVMASGASSLKRVTLELGGNDACIVLDDADIDVVALRIFGAATFNCGQVCIAAKRVYAPGALYDRLCDALAALAEKAVVGDGATPGTQIGPLQNDAQLEKARHYMDVARRDGRIVAGGRIEAASGYFIRPTIVRDISEQSPLVADEQFCPILPVIRYDNLDDAISQANHSQYGLGGSIWSRDISRARKVADRFSSGTIWINHHLHFGPHIPLAGARQSGVGVEFSLRGLAEYAQPTVISIALN